MCSVPCREVPDFQLNIWRYFTQLPLLYIVKRKGLTSLLEVNKVMWMLLLVVLLGVFQVCYFRSASLLPLGSHNACFQTSLLVTITLSASFIFREQLGSLKPIALALTVIGLLLVTQPQPLFSHNNVSSDVSTTSQKMGNHSQCMEDGNNGSRENTRRETDNGTFPSTTSGFQYSRSTTVGYVLVVAAGAVESALFIVTKHRCDGIDPMVQTVFFSFSVMFMSFPLAIYFESIKMNYTTQEVMYLLGHSVTSTMQIFLVMYAIQNISSVIMSMVYGMSVVFSFCLQYTALKGIYPGHGNWIEVLGAALTLAGIVMASVVELIQERVNTAI